MNRYIFSLNHGTLIRVFCVKAICRLCDCQSRPYEDPKVSLVKHLIDRRDGSKSPEQSEHSVIKRSVTSRVRARP